MKDLVEATDEEGKERKENVIGNRKVPCLAAFLFENF